MPLPLRWISVSVNVWSIAIVLNLDECCFCIYIVACTGGWCEYVWSILYMCAIYSLEYTDFTECSSYIVISVHKSHLNRASNSFKIYDYLRIVLFIVSIHLIFKRVACIFDCLFASRTEYVTRLADYLKKKRKKLALIGYLNGFEWNLISTTNTVLEFTWRFPFSTESQGHFVQNKCRFDEHSDQSFKRFERLFVYLIEQKVT